MCQCCVEKWSKDHRCSYKIQLHALEEVLEAFMISDDITQYDASGASQIFLSLSGAVVTGDPSPRTLYLKGTIQGQHISILVDSSSSHTFISSALAVNPSRSSLIADPLKV
jgi:hypothetical protein